MNICMIGTGYVGLVAGTCLSDFGMNVTCVDKDEDKIESLKKGVIPIYEMGLADLVKKNRELNRLHFSTDLKAAVDQSLVIFLAVGTPEGPDGAPDMTAIHTVAKQVASCMTEYKVIAIKSTVPVGTAESISRLIKESLTSDIDFDIVSNPEFLREGAAVNDFLRPDRVILGASSDRALAIMKDIYRPLYLLDTPIVTTDNKTAEIIKYASNTVLALKISFINEIANLCDIVGADVYRVATAMGMDKRIGSKFLHPGPGYGGSCFPKDVTALVNKANEVGYDFKLGQAILDVNARQRRLVVDKAIKTLGDPKNKTVCILGLSFKPETDDVRESPALTIAEMLKERGIAVRVYDPVAMAQAKKELSGVEYCSDAYHAAEGSDMVIIVTEWNEFRDLNLEKLKRSMRTPILYDTRNIYNPEKVRKMGYTYLGTGRP